MSLNGWLTPARRMLVVLSRVVLSLGGLSPVVLALAGCAWLGWGGPGANLPPIPPAESDAYHLGPGDQIRIITLSEDRLTGEFRVNDSGAVALPLLGTIQAAGLTTAELERTIGADLVKAQLIRDPSVSVEVLAYRPIFVLGEVNKPGQYRVPARDDRGDGGGGRRGLHLSRRRGPRGHRAQRRRQSCRGAGGAADVCPAR